LVTTLLLMLLLAVITMGMLSLSALSLRAARQEQAVATARANARLAMMLAMGELQRLTGPDARVTATADLAGTANGLPLPTGVEPGNGMTVHGVPKGLTALRTGTRHWTGVWENADAPDEVFTRTPQPRHLGWLVSGGHIPAEPGQALVELVGEHTAGPDPERHVAAPLVNAPGAAGRLAWWVDDEGVKAKLNLAPATVPGRETRGRRMRGSRCSRAAVTCGIRGIPETMMPHCSAAACGSHCPQPPRFPDVPTKHTPDSAA
jgi:hypothetical protein